MSLLLVAAALAQAPIVIAQAPVVTPSTTLPAPVAQTPTPATPSTSATPSPSPPPATSAPSFIFLAMPTATACENVNVMWAYTGQNADKFGVDIYAFNVGVNQSVPPPSTSTTLSVPAQQTPASSPSPTPATTPAAQPTTAPAQPTTQAPAPAATTTGIIAAGGGAGAPVAGPPQQNSAPGRREFSYPPMLVARDIFARADINATVTKGWQANVLNTWKVNVPPGRYRLFAIVNDTWHTNAISPDAFTVLQGTDSSCIQVASQNPIVSQPPTSSATSAGTTKPSGSGTAVGSNEGNKSKGIGGGAIAGIIIGVLAGLALLGLLLFCCMRRRRNGADRARGGLGDGGPGVNGKQVGEPTAFRHLKRPSSFGHIGTSLGSLGRSRDQQHNTLPSDDMSHEKGVSNLGISNLTPLPYRDASLAQNGHLVPPEQQRRGSNYSTTTSNDNPFETAPSTPIDEKTSFAAPIGLAAAVAAAGGAGAAVAHQRTSDRNGTDSQTSSTSPSSGDGASSAALVGTPNDPRRLSNPAPGGLAPPPANLTPAYGTPNPASGRSTPPSPPLTNTAPGSPNPPSSFNSQGISGSPRPAAADRKASLRRKPVPRLAADDEAARSDGHGSGSGSGHDHAASSEWGHTSAPVEIGRLPELRIGGGPAGDEFGLSAALGLGDRPSSSGNGNGDKKTFHLIPDQPLRQD